MRFLRKIGVAHFEEHYIEDLLVPIEERFINYKTKYTPEKEANIPADD